MSTTPTSSPAGWYPAPDGSPATWWWDGARWTPPGSQPSQQPTTTNAITKLATATQVLLAVCGLMSVITIGVETFGISAVTGYLNGHAAAIDLLNSYDQITFVVTILSVVALLATGVLWVLWQYRAAKHLPGHTRRSPGWHVGSWFVPVICVWFPYQNISDLWRAVGRSRPAWQILWWLCWLVSNVLIQISSRIYTSAQDLDQFRVAMSVSIAGEVLLLAAAPLAWLIVRGITEGIVRRSAVHVALTY
ncbi:MAG TPA: DUF4328 domain-containing protein [Microbacterium sp.]|uniref:DUF4328 domain-containing protein n=1 Tax=Microbacterium sp. TaxID=51671 RepID=UPI002F9455BD